MRNSKDFFTLVVFITYFIITQGNVMVVKLLKTYLLLSAISTL